MMILACKPDSLEDCAKGPHTIGQIHVNGTVSCMLNAHAINPIVTPEGHNLDIRDLRQSVKSVGKTRLVHRHETVTCDIFSDVGFQHSKAECMS